MRDITASQGKNSRGIVDFPSERRNRDATRANPVLLPLSPLATLTIRDESGRKMKRNPERKVDRLDSAWLKGMIGFECLIGLNA